MHFNPWRHPGTGQLRLYLQRDSIQRLLEACDLDTSQWADTHPRIWLQPTRDNGWRLMAIGSDGSRAFDKSQWRQACKAVESTLGITHDTGWPYVVEAALPLPDDNTEPASGETNDTDHVRSHWPVLQTPVVLSLGRRETTTVSEQLERHSQVTTVRDPEQWADCRFMNERGDELLIVRQRCQSSEANAQSDERAEQWLLRYSDYLGFIAASTDHRIVPVIVIEGDPHFHAHHLSRRQIDGALAYVSATDQVSVMSSFDLNHSVDIILRLVAHFSRSATVGDGKRRGETLLDYKRAMLSMIPGLSQSLAEALLEHFGSVGAIANASVRSIQQVEGIGEKRALAIQRILNHGNY